MRNRKKFLICFVKGNEKKSLLNQFSCLLYETLFKDTFNVVRHSDAMTPDVFDVLLKMSPDSDGQCFCFFLLLQVQERVIWMVTSKNEKKYAFVASLGLGGFWIEGAGLDLEVWESYTHKLKWGNMTRKCIAH